VAYLLHARTVDPQEHRNTLKLATVEAVSQSYKCLFAIWSSKGEDVNAEAGELSLLRFVTR
jgi:hypothetical protein